MGLIASSFRVMYLTAYRISLETKIQWIASAKLDLVSSSNDIMDVTREDGGIRPMMNIVIR